MLREDAPVVAGIAEKDPAVLGYALEEAQRSNDVCVHKQLIVEPLQGVVSTLSC